MASISKELFHWTDTYTIDVADPGDALYALMVVLAIDAEKCSRNFELPGRALRKEAPSRIFFCPQSPSRKCIPVIFLEKSRVLWYHKLILYAHHTGKWALQPAAPRKERGTPLKSRVFEIIAAEQARQNATVELIASENFVSENVMRAVGSCLTNKYSEGYPAGHPSGNRGRYYGGCGCVDELEEYCCHHVAAGIRDGLSRQCPAP